jgi:GT2 family glycosyltransferase
MKSVVSVIIPIFNGINLTKKCLESLFNIFSASDFKVVDFKIIVVDDGSTDGSAAWISENYPSVHILYGDGGLWWSGGINKGMAYALQELNTDYVLWWNNDIIPGNDYFTQVEKLISANDDDILIGSKVFILDKNLIWGMGGRFNPVKGTKFMYGMRQKDCDTYRKPFEVDWFPGMGTIIHRKVFDRIGMLDEDNFPQYHGDSDFTYRAKKAGFRLMVFPELVIYNDITNTGLIHGGRFSNLYRSITSIKSNFNLRKDISFYSKHASSPFAFMALVKKYSLYIGGFYKWKLLNFFGIKKT